MNSTFQKDVKRMFRSTFVYAVVLSSVCGYAVGQETPAAPAGTIDEVSRQATALEGELGKYKDSAPEAGEALFKLTELYYEHGRVFGVVRSA